MVARKGKGSGFRDTRLSGLLNVGAVLALVPMLVLVVGCPVPPGVDCTADDASECPADTPLCLVDASDETGESNLCVACLADSDCDNGTFCDGDESCTDNACADGTAPCTDAQECDDDADVCVDLCDDDAGCDDGDFCNGEEACVDGACADGDAPCADGEVCDEDADGCVECLTDGDCGADQVCTDNVCEDEVVEPEGLSVSIAGCPENAGSGSTFALTASSDGGTDGGRVDFTWTITGTGTLAGDDDDTPETVDVTVTGASGVTVTVSGQDNSIETTPGTDAVVSETVCADDTGCPEGDTCNADLFCETPAVDAVDTATAVGDPATAECSPEVDVVINVSAGADQSAAVVFNASAPIVFSTANVPALAATASDPSAQAGETLQHEWTVVSTPDATLQPLDTVDLLAPFGSGNASTTDVLINPPGIASTQNLLKQDGSTTTRTNVVVPGPYEFLVTVTNPRGVSDSDTVVRTIAPAWIPQAAANGSAAAMAATGGLYNQVLTPAGGANFDFESLSRVGGAIDFTSVDVDTATNVTDLSSETVVASDTVSTLMVPFPASTRGTYTVNAGLNAGQVSVASAVTGGRVLVGTDWASTTVNTELAIVAASIGQPQSTSGGRLYAGVVNDAVGGAAATTNSEALRGQNILFADIKNDGGMHMIVWGGADANANYDAQDIRIYKPVANQKGNANTLGFANANYTFLEQVDSGCTVSGVAIGPLRGDSTKPELVVACNAADPLVKIYDSNGATGSTDKVYSVQSNQTTVAAPSTITFDYTNSNTGTIPATIALAPFSSTSYNDLIFGDGGFDGGADGFIEGKVIILQGGSAGAVPSPGFSISTGAAFANLPANKWDSYTGVATSAIDEPFFGFAMATGPFTSTTLHDVYVGGPGNDEATANNMAYNGAVFRIPGGSALNSTDATTATLSVSWAGEGSGGDQFGFAVATTPAGQIVIAATENAHTANTADGAGKVYVYPAATANAVNAATIPSVAGEQASDFFGIRMTTGVFEGAEMVVAASSGGNYFKLIPTGGTLSNPIIPMTKVTITAIDTSSAVSIGDHNGDGKNDIVVSRSGADQVTALWGRQ